MDKEAKKIVVAALLIGAACGVISEFSVIATFIIFVPAGIRLATRTIKLLYPVYDSSGLNSDVKPGLVIIGVMACAAVIGGITTRILSFHLYQ